MTALTAPEFTNEAAAVAHLEASRWPKGGVSCPHCGSLNVHKMGGKTQAGYFQCNDCRDKFTCRTGTVMERSKIPVHKWLLAIHVMSSAKNGMSAHELHRLLGITYKSAWFLAHRIREAMDETKSKTPPTPMGGKGSSIQADETYYLNTSKRAKGYKKGIPKAAVLALVEKPSGRVRAKHITNGVSAADVREFLVANANLKSELHTDESALYTKVGKEFAAHKPVYHGSRPGPHDVGKNGETTNRRPN